MNILYWFLGSVKPVDREPCPSCTWLGYLICTLCDGLALQHSKQPRQQRENVSATNYAKEFRTW